jgi:hypothetical protein
LFLVRVLVLVVVLGLILVVVIVLFVLVVLVLACLFDVFTQTKQQQSICSFDGFNIVENGFNRFIP